MSSGFAQLMSFGIASLVKSYAKLFIEYSQSKKMEVNVKRRLSMHGLEPPGNNVNVTGACSYNRTHRRIKKS